MADLVQRYVTGGQYTATAAAGASGAGSVYSGVGILCKVIATTSGTAATSIYDAASATGNPIYVVPASPTIGVVNSVDIPVTTGIYVGGALNTSALTLTYDKDGVNGK